MQNTRLFHVYNRGVEKRDVYIDIQDYNRFLESLFEFNDIEPVKSLWMRKKLDCRPNYKTREQLVDIYAYCLVPNHYHLLLMELVEGGLQEYMKRIGGGFTNYFNVRHERVGYLFQGKYKKIQINSYKYLNQIYSYIAYNAFIHRLPGAAKWQYSSANNKKYSHIITDPEKIVGRKFVKLIQSKKEMQRIIASARLNKEISKYKLD